MENHDNSIQVGFLIIQILQVWVILLGKEQQTAEVLAKDEGNTEKVVEEGNEKGSRRVEEISAAIT